MSTIDNSRVWVLGCDPGSNSMALGLISRLRHKVAYVDHLLLTMSSKRPLSERLVVIDDAVSRFLALYPEISVAGIETPVLGRGPKSNPKSLVTLAQARAALVRPIAAAGIPIQDINPATMKMRAAGSGRASKDDVARMVELQLGWPVPPPKALKSRDVTDSLGMALAVQTTAPLREVS